MKRWVCLLGVMVPGALAAAEPARIAYETVAVHPHDPQAWTQGLYFYKGSVYESTGLRGQSTLREVELGTGRVKRQVELENRHFAEGLTFFRGRLYQLTWQGQVGFIYDPLTFRQTGVFSYDGEGWGLTHDDASLIMSNGTATVSFLDPSDFRVTRRIEVKRNGEPVPDLNELEFVNGFLYANVWYSDEILKIDPATGEVAGVVDLSKLWPERPAGEGKVLNGIAFDPESGCFLVTGKFWSKLFVIRLESIK